MAGLQGRAFGGYQLVEQLPAGGIADVYRGRAAKPGGKDVVVKVIYPEFARQPGFLPRFRHIVQMAGKLASHPHVLPLLGSGEDAGYLYLVTPYVEAGTLRDWLQKGGRMGLADIGPFFRQLCDALGYAHSLGVLHGNLKPSNVFLFEGRHVLLGDFGMLWDVSHMDMNHAGSGTDAVEYLAPEVLSGQITQFSDIYSLGAVLFASAAGRAPFHGGKAADVFAAHARQPVPSLAQVNPALAGGVVALDAIIQRAMAKRPEDRFLSAAAVAQTIDVTTHQAQAAASAPIFGTAPVAPGFTPLGTGFPGMPSGGIAPVFGVPAAAPVPGIASVPGIMSAGAAPTTGGALGQLDPPFPPLPATAQVEEQMEHGRALPQPMETGTQATVRVPAPNVAKPGTGVPQQPTMHVPAPLVPAGDASFAGLLESSHQLPAVPAGPGSSSIPPGIRPFRLSGSPAAKLGGSSGLAGATSSPPFRPGEFDDDENDDEDSMGPQMLPAVRPGGPEVSGFAVAGGAGAAHGDAPAYDSEHRRSEHGWTGEASAFAPGESREWRFYDGASQAMSAVAGPRPGDQPASASGWGNAGGATDEFGASGVSGWTGEFAGERGGFGDATDGDGFSGEFQASAPNEFRGGDQQSHGDGRAFSPTQLGLPRLTSPVLAEQPPSFHDILSESNQFPRFEGAVAVGERPPTWADAGANMWGGSAGSADWAASEAGAWSGAPGMNGAMPQPTTPWDQPAPADPRASGGKIGRKGKRADPEEDFGFDDERVWTVGSTAVHANRRRWVRKLALFLLLLLLVDVAALVVTRPDLCPTNSCKQASAFIHQKVPFLHAPNIAAPVPLVAAPSSLSVKVVSGKVATTPLVLTNIGKADLTWKAAAALSWLALKPSSGTLGAGAHQPVAVTAKPIGIKPGNYTSTLTITTDKGTVSVPISIAVAAGALLRVSPDTLTFSSCGAAQTVTIKNDGAAALKFTAVPSQTSALSLDTTSGSLGPGQSGAIGVTLLCAATTGNDYTVSIISDSGSAVVTIHYT